MRWGFWMGAAIDQQICMEQPVPGPVQVLWMHQSTNWKDPCSHGASVIAAEEGSKCNKLVIRYVISAIEKKAEVDQGYLGVCCGVAQEDCSFK